MAGMRFPLSSLFAITTYVAILTVGVVIGQSWPPGLWLMALVVILVSHLHLHRKGQSPEARAYFRQHPEQQRGEGDKFP